MAIKGTGSKHKYWVIMAGNTPTAFRARTRDVLLPTLVQLQRAQPNTTLQWFERNRLWPSPIDAREAMHAKRQMRPTRGRDWRPGGEHKDPRARFKVSRDQKRARFKRRRFDPRGKPGAKPPVDE